MNCLSFSESSCLSLAYSHFMLYILLKLTTQNQIDISMAPKQFSEIAESSPNMPYPSVRLQIQDQYVKDIPVGNKSKIVYWDVVWNFPGSNGTKGYPGNPSKKFKGYLDRMEGTNLKVVVENEEQVELSFTRTWDPSLKGYPVPLTIDKRFVMLRGSSGFYSYAIYEHLAESPAFDLDNTRIALKLRKDKFRYMAIADNRQRFMPLPEDRLPPRGQTLAYPEAVRLINPVEPEFKGEMMNEVQIWPYDFPASVDFPSSDQRGNVCGRLLVHDRYISENSTPGIGSYVGLALPGDVGSWQRECKGYQFWTIANEDGYFSIKNVRTGVYNLFRQYGLWERYAELYPDGDLVYMIGNSDYRKDWFFAQVTRKTNNNTYEGTTWQIKFKLDNVDESATYKLRVALATAHSSELQVRINDPMANPLFTSGVIGKDNTIARHGIHGLYWLFEVKVPGTHVVEGNNTIFLTQPLSTSPFQGIMYDYIRLEGPCPSNSSKNP
ncbi:hypothetical protein SO802_032672 [Lithocarpus litseifolius]|uniref:Rhamnogalacturonan lyase domain-containing protein n=1 Tax=Lithocarpus litseifolius TaxID=425828 RepID=A0AAW2BCV2_9ROSI